MSTGYYEAATLSREMHAGQVDKAGADYFSVHIEEVVRIVREELGGTIKDAVVAYLHDVVEDTPVTIEQVEAQFGVDIAAHVEAVTHRDGERYIDYILRIRAHGGSAVIVKHADLLDHIRRGENISESLLRRYEKALATLLA